VQHEGGSLEAAVAAVRRRNLGISFGILLLLTISVVLLTMSSRREQRLARQQMEFVAGVSHEPRTPVAVIRSAAENLAQGVVASGERVKRYGETIEAEARRLGDMVERGLQYADQRRRPRARHPANGARTHLQAVLPRRERARPPGPGTRPRPLPRRAYRRLACACTRDLEARRSRSCCRRRGPGSGPVSATAVEDAARS
jgi:signal transduction histidine kinase